MSQVLSWQFENSLTLVYKTPCVRSVFSPPFHGHQENHRFLLSYFHGCLSHYGTIFSQAFCIFSGVHSIFVSNCSVCLTFSILYFFIRFINVSSIYDICISVFTTLLKLFNVDSNSTFQICIQYSPALSYKKKNLNLLLDSSIKMENHSFQCPYLKLNENQFYFDA